ncbi:MAG TPA: type I phosphomannose isomerase catalytic subunit [Candidatus Didemnitutus sp.]|nr:type I phosphomannose isomerase catalytic subunit [Candidatus Didemnitutus sp.]
MISPLKFAPIYQDRVWGGRALESLLGRTLPPGRPIGESWEVVDRPEAQSRVVDGPWAGLTLREVIAAKPERIMGRGWRSDRVFPILVKWLDCRERLSLQVHPPATIAAGLGGEPKTENWFIAHAEPAAAVLAGLKAGVDAAKFRASLRDHTAESLVERLATRSGDSVLIRSGVMHAIDAGNLILEIQQNSDTTYRVYDWGRVGLDGKPRALHIEQSMACLEANTAPNPKLVRAAATDQVLAECAEFRISRRVPGSGQSVVFPAGEPRLISVVDGTLKSDRTELRRGDNALLPAAEEQRLVAGAATTFLVTDRFTHLSP